MKYFLYLGLWNEHKGAPGIALFSLDSETGKADFIRQEDDRISSGDIVINKEKNILYLCNETEKIFGFKADTGIIYGFTINPENGSLNKLFQTETYCPNPCYIILGQGDSGHKDCLIAANYGTSGFTADFIKTEDGSFVPHLCQKKSLLQVYHLNEDGIPDRITDIIEHAADPDGKGIGTNIHCCNFSPCGKFIAVTNKGNGKLYLYRFDSNTQTLSITDSVITAEGMASPRYCLFHPSLPFIYVNQEKEKGGRMMINTYSYNVEGHLTEVSSVNVLPEGTIIPERARYEQQGFAISKDGRFLYTCLKGPDCICVLKTEEDGSAKVIQTVPVKGDWPRGLALTPDGKACIVSAHCSGELNVYRVGADGTLEPSDICQGPVGGSNMAFYEMQ